MGRRRVVGVASVPGEIIVNSLLITASALALASFAAPAVAQHQHMPGMTMPMPAQPVAGTDISTPMDHSHMARMDMPMGEHPGHMSMTGALQYHGDADRVITPVATRFEILIVEIDLDLFVEVF